MKIHRRSDCIFNDRITWCTNKNVKRSLFGLLGLRMCKLLPDKDCEYASAKTQHTSERDSLLSSATCFTNRMDEIVYLFFNDECKHAFVDYERWEHFGPMLEQLFKHRIWTSPSDNLETWMMTMSGSGLSKDDTTMWYSWLFSNHRRFIREFMSYLSIKKVQELHGYLICNRAIGIGVSFLKDGSITVCGTCKERGNSTCTDDGRIKRRWLMALEEYQQECAFMRHNKE